MTSGESGPTGTEETTSPRWPEVCGVPAQRTRKRSFRSQGRGPRRRRRPAECIHADFIERKMKEQEKQKKREAAAVSGATLSENVLSMVGASLGRDFQHDATARMWMQMRTRWWGFRFHLPLLYQRRHANARHRRCKAPLISARVHRISPAPADSKTK